MQMVLNNWNIVQLDSLKLGKGESIHSIDEKSENLWRFVFQFVISVQIKSKSTKKAQIVVIWLSCVVIKHATVGSVIYQRKFR